MINPSLELQYHELCELHKESKKVAQHYYQLLYAERKLIKLLKETYRPGESYTKWSHRARAIARKTMGRGGKGKHRGAVDHIRPLLLEFLEGKTPEEASRKENLQVISKEANRKKSYLI